MEKAYAFTKLQSTPEENAVIKIFTRKGKKIDPKLKTIIFVDVDNTLSPDIKNELSTYTHIKKFGSKNRYIEVLDLLDENEKLELDKEIAQYKKINNIEKESNKKHVDAIEKIKEDFYFKKASDGKYRIPPQNFILQETLKVIEYLHKTYCNATFVILSQRLINVESFDGAGGWPEINYQGSGDKMGYVQYFKEIVFKNKVPEGKFSFVNENGNERNWDWKSFGDGEKGEYAREIVKKISKGKPCNVIFADNGWSNLGLVQKHIIGGEEKTTEYFQGAKIKDETKIIEPIENVASFTAIEAGASYIIAPSGEKVCFNVPREGDEKYSDITYIDSVVQQDVGPGWHEWGETAIDGLSKNTLEQKAYTQKSQLNQSNQSETYYYPDSDNDGYTDPQEAEQKFNEIANNKTEGLSKSQNKSQYGYQDEAKNKTYGTSAIETSAVKTDNLKHQSNHNEFDLSDYNQNWATRFQAMQKNQKSEAKEEKEYKIRTLVLIHLPKDNLNKPNTIDPATIDLSKCVVIPDYTNISGFSEIKYEQEIARILILHQLSEKEIKELRNRNFKDVILYLKENNVQIYSLKINSEDVKKGKQENLLGDGVKLKEYFNNFCKFAIANQNVIETEEFKITKVEKKAEINKPDNNEKIKQEEPPVASSNIIQKQLVQVVNSGKAVKTGSSDEEFKSCENANATAVNNKTFSLNQSGGNLAVQPDTNTISAAKELSQPKIELPNANIISSGQSLAQQPQSKLGSPQLKEKQPPAVNKSSCCNIF